MAADQLQTRINVLAQAGFVDERGKEALEAVVRVLTGTYDIPADDRAVGGIITHLASALKRIGTGEEVQPFAPELVQQVLESDDHPLAARISDEVFRALPVELPEDERVYVVAHVESIILAEREKGHEVCRSGGVVQTVRGLIPAADLGVTLAHEHLVVDLGRIRGDEDATFGDSELVRSEVAAARDVGVRSIVEVSCCDMGRDPEALRAISEACDVNIVCSTGFYHEVYHPAWVETATVADVRDFFLKEFEEGVADTGIRPGVIGEVAGEADDIPGSELTVMKAAAQAATCVGCAVTTHCQLGRMALEQADVLLGEGIEPGRVVLGHLDLANDMDYYRSVLATGVNIAFDTFGKEAYLADTARVDNLVKLIDEGYAGQLLLSNDVSRKSYMRARGGHGYAGVMEHAVPALLARGDYEAAVHQMLVENPARVFTIGGVA